MKLIIFGSNEISILAKFYFQNDTNIVPVAFCVDSEFVKETNLEGIPVIPFEEISKYYPPQEAVFFAPIYNNFLRKKKTDEISKKGYSFANYISSKSIFYAKKIGINCFIMENNTIQPYVEIGNNVIFWSGNHIGHHTVVRDNVFFSSHVVVSGKCIIEDYCWFGVNSCVKDGLTIGEGSFVAMGSVITKKTKSYRKYIGNPAKEYGDVLNDFQ